jgi:uncharacterized integral membrane protein (TIGR00698 family)
MRSSYDVMSNQRLHGAVVVLHAGVMNLPAMHAARRGRGDGLRAEGLSLASGLLWAGLGVGCAMVAHRLVGQVGVLTWSVVLGIFAANCNLIGEAAESAMRLSSTKLLRVGVVLLGFSLPLSSIAALGAPLVALVVVTLVTTLLVTTWLGRRMGLSGPRSLLIGTGVAICGASAIAAMEKTAEADDTDVAVAVGMITLYGTLAMLALPLLQDPFNLHAAELGAWTSASVHEVGQVIGAASPAGAAALAVATVVKLIRVLMLAPVVAVAGLLRRRAAAGHARSAKLPPLVPLFVLGFLGCVVARSTGLVPPEAWTCWGTYRLSHLQLDCSGWVRACTCGPSSAPRVLRLRSPPPVPPPWR